MPGMNRNSRSIRLIETYLADLESGPRASPADFKTMAGWYRRWLLAARRVVWAAAGNSLKDAVAEVERVLR